MPRKFLQKPQKHRIYARTKLLIVAYPMYQPRIWDCQLPEKVFQYRKISHELILTEAELEHQVLSSIDIFGRHFGPADCIYAGLIDNESEFEEFTFAIENPFEKTGTGIPIDRYNILTKYLPTLKKYKIVPND